MCPFYVKETRRRLTRSGGFSLLDPDKYLLSCENNKDQESVNF